MSCNYVYKQGYKKGKTCDQKISKKCVDKKCVDNKCACNQLAKKYGKTQLPLDLLQFDKRFTGLRRYVNSPPNLM